MSRLLQEREREREGDKSWVKLMNITFKTVIHCNWDAIVTISSVHIIPWERAARLPFATVPLNG